MAFTHTNTIVWERGNDRVSKQFTRTADGETNRDVAVAGASTDLQIDVALDISALSMLCIVCDRDITLETNSGSAADDTIALKAGEPLLWWSNSPLALPLTVDVVSIFATLAAGTAATLSIRALHDSTP